MNKTKILIDKFWFFFSFLKNFYICIQAVYFEKQICHMQLPNLINGICFFFPFLRFFIYVIKRYSMRNKYVICSYQI